MDMAIVKARKNKMSRRVPKKKTPKDINQLAAFIVEQTTKDKDDKTSPLDNTKKPHS